MSDLTQEQIDRFDGYPTDCIIEELLDAEKEISNLKEENERLKYHIKKLDAYASCQCGKFPCTCGYTALVVRFAND